jgi:LuxR family maltose regulon positive regulatory protein
MILHNHCIILQNTKELTGRVTEPPSHAALSVLSPDLHSDMPPLRTADASPTPAPALPLLTTKLYIPPARPQLLPRPRLLAQLDAGMHCKLTLLSAPAGFGKTTLLGAWRATTLGSAIPFAWVSLDTTDSEPVRFWSYVIAALETLQPGSGAIAVELLQSSRPPPIDVVLTPLLNALSTLPTDAVLVLDDYHLIDAPAIHGGLAFLIDHLPPQLHLMLTTRADPPLPLTRLRARGRAPGMSARA